MTRYVKVILQAKVLPPIRLSVFRSGAYITAGDRPNLAETPRFSSSLHQVQNDIRNVLLWQSSLTHEGRPARSSEGRYRDCRRFFSAAHVNEGVLMLGQPKAPGFREFVVSIFIERKWRRNH